MYVPNQFAWFLFLTCSLLCLFLCLLENFINRELLNVNKWSFGNFSNSIKTKSISLCYDGTSQTSVSKDLLESLLDPDCWACLQRFDFIALILCFFTLCWGLLNRQALWYWTVPLTPKSTFHISYQLMVLLLVLG